jgi:tetratricopeptide (TPR) repeat protein
MRLHLLCLLFNFSTLTADAAGFDMNAGCREAYTHIQSLQFGKARELIATEKKLNAGNAAIVYLEGYIDFLSAFITEENRFFDQQKKMLEGRLNSLESVKDADAWTRMARAELIMQVAINKLKWQEFLTAGYLFRRAYKLLEENREQHPGFYPTLKSLGFCHAAIGAVPANYQWLSNLAGMKGTVAQGAAELDKLILEISVHPGLQFLSQETQFIRAFVAIHFEKNHALALQIADKTETEKSPGPLQRFLTADVYVLTGNTPKALAYLKSAKSVSGELRMSYLDYMTGSLKLEVLDYTAASDLDRFTTHFKGRSFIKAAWQKQGWIRLLQNDTAGYYRCMEAVKNSGNEFTDEDKQAQLEAVSGVLPNIVLLRARLLTDGGQYTAALGEVAGKPVSTFRNTREQLELTYRLARIYDKMNHKEKALEYYNLTVTNGASRPYYFAANSALLSGLIYEERGEKTKAVEWYKKCLSMRNHEYQNSIDQKAKSGLDRLEGNDK